MNLKYAPLLAQLEKELAETAEAMEFWRAQPPSGLAPWPGVTDLSVNRVSDLDDDADDTRRLIETVRSWGA